MNRNNQLLKNTLLLGVSKIMTQLIAFILVPIYTFFLSPKDFGTIDLIVSYMALIVPFITVQLELASFRFSLDARHDSKKLSQIISTIFSIVLPIVMIVSIVFLSLSIFINLPYVYLIIINIISSVIATILLQFSRGVGDTKAFATASIVMGFLTATLSIFFIVILHLSASSILLSTALSNISVVIYLFFRLKLHNLLSIKNVDPGVSKDLLNYSFPLLPNNISWWVLNVSDRTIISIFLGVVANGIYAIAYKFAYIPAVLFGIFNMSWSESASMHINSSDKDSYFSKILNSSMTAYVSFSAFFISIFSIFFPFLVGSEYVESYNFIPILVFSACAQGLIGLYSAVYIAKKETKQIAQTSLFAAVINIAVNLSLINFIGLYAAAISTFVAFFAMLIHRHLDVKRHVLIKYNKRTLVILALISFLATISYYLNNIYLSLIIAALIIIITIGLNRKILSIIYSLFISKTKSLLHIK